MDLQLRWNKCQGDVWCRLATVNLAHEHFNQMSGIYVIWHGGPQPATLKVGRGNIRAELARNRTDPQVQEFANSGLFVTWADVSPENSQAAQAFVALRLKPKIASGVSAVPGFSATLPW